MAIKLRKKTESFIFYNNDGEKIERETEIRLDPLTGESSRLVYDAGLAIAPTDYSEAAEKTKGANCPFCPENIFKLTPVFPDKISEEGRIIEGEALVFPNLFPYSKHNGVVVFSGDHFVRLNEFTPQFIINAFKAAQRYIHKVGITDSQAKFASINWNYLPLSGGSIIHPHLHIIISDSGTNYQTLTYEKARQFEMETGKSYFLELYETEKSIGERWIAEAGTIGWLHAFAPKSHNDYISIFQNATSIEDIEDADWHHFANGLQNIFSLLIEQGFPSFNLVLSIDPEEKEPIHVRLIPRMTLGALDTSDINFFQVLHQEPLTYKAPEVIAALARGQF
ncbi:hypothetical protein D4T97_014515 [Siminovitchia acidinfaciens]|uniref:Galactose-1-phosphate uridylyltransferase n=1 Tax=Siminovitchia acidinfaciens TaxID=2321395 RepID=A0A429XX64_9BACI|nr:hypothetical protein [Siminovitchia acidinfaciens]RST73089.1 hypothetical protein D4T97_014515 [Siminovitchia acidinfaciens]